MGTGRSENRRVVRMAEGEEFSLRPSLHTRGQNYLLAITNSSDPVSRTTNLLIKQRYPTRMPPIATACSAIRARNRGCIQRPVSAPLFGPALSESLRPAVRRVFPDRPFLTGEARFTDPRQRVPAASRADRHGVARRKEWVDSCVTPTFARNHLPAARRPRLFLGR